MVNRMNMQYAEANGNNISRIMLGTAQIGLKGYGIASQTGNIDANKLLSYCESAGINCYDTAREYGDAEEKLGTYFHQKTKPLFVSKFKIPIDTALLNREIEKRMYDTVESTLNNLKIQQVGVMMVHEPDMLLHHGATITSTLKKMKNEGLISKGGISLGARSDKQYQDYWNLFQDDIYEMIQIPMNILDHRLLRNGAVSSFHDSNKIIVVRSVFLQGLLFLSEDSLPEHLTEAKKPLRILRQLANEEGMSVAQMALSFIRDIEGVSSMVIGADHSEHIEDNLKLLHGPSISDKTQASICKLLSDVPDYVITPGFWPRK